jgi:hypothetical protein
VVLEIPAPTNRAAQESNPAAAGGPPSARASGGDAVAAHADSVAQALAGAGIRVARDARSRGETPGSRMFAWEGAGVPVRAEVGQREAATGRVTLALHPSIVSACGGGDALLARLQRRRALARLLRFADSGGAAALPGRALRLAPVPVADAPEACLELLAAAASAFGLSCSVQQQQQQQQQHACSGDGSSGSGSGSGSSTPASREHQQRGADSSGELGVECGEPPQPRTRPILLPHGVCPKLHLWPAVDPPPCPVHVRHLMGAGLPCHCRTAQHVGMRELRAEVEAALLEARGQRVERWEGRAGEPPPPPVTMLFVSGLPQDADWGVAALRQRLEDALAPYNPSRGARTWRAHRYRAAN